MKDYKKIICLCLLLLAYYSVRLNSSNCKVKTIKCTYQNGGGTMKKILLVDDEHKRVERYATTCRKAESDNYLLKISDSSRFRRNPQRG